MPSISARGPDRGIRFMLPFILMATGIPNFSHPSDDIGLLVVYSPGALLCARDYDIE